MAKTSTNQLVLIEWNREHEQKTEELFTTVGSKTLLCASIIGDMTGKSCELWANIIALGGGAKDPWQNVQQLYISTLIQ